MSIGHDFLRDHAGLILRQTLASLMKYGQDNEWYATRVFQALMLACDVGYRAGIHPTPRGDGKTMLIAVIQLPTGSVAFPIDPYPAVFEIPTDTEQQRRIHVFADNWPGKHAKQTEVPAPKNWCGNPDHDDPCEACDNMTR